MLGQPTFRTSKSILPVGIRPSTPVIPVEQRIIIAQEGYSFARQHRDKWFQAVNQCPHGPARADGGGIWEAHAWYEGFWFFFYVMKPWLDVIQADGVAVDPKSTT